MTQPVVSRRIVRTGLAASVVLTASLVACGSGRPVSEESDQADPSQSSAAPTALAANSRLETDTGSAREDLAFYIDAARTAWRVIDRNYNPQTGLISATTQYEYATTWDIGSGIAALYAAKELGFLPEDEYRTRMSRLLGTLRDAPLFDGVAYHKVYSTETGGMVDRRSRPSTRGYGWSATDLGRFLVWLRIVAENDPEFADEIQAIVDRMDYGTIVRDGYLRGRFVEGNIFQEGRIGYEQYAATGFALWGHRAERALETARHLEEATVLGVTLPRDERGLDRLLSEPFVLMGLELGWSPEFREMAEAVLAVQRARYERTGQVTMVSEDAVSVPPYYFYYYCIVCNGEEFIIDVSDPGSSLDEPRWVSTKSAFGWHALLPNEYTRLALDAVAGARSEDGWASGVFEGSGSSTETYDVNTAAVILESALYLQKGGPILGRPPR